MLAVDAREQPISTVLDLAEELAHEGFHLTALFPVSTASVCALTAGGAVNTFGAWAEIADDQGVPDTLSSKAASIGPHISPVMVEDVSAVDKDYLLEIGYGASNTLISRHRFRSGTVINPTIQQVRVRNVAVPAGEAIRCRMMRETAGATRKVNVRRHEENV